MSMRGAGVILCLAAALGAQPSVAPATGRAALDWRDVMQFRAIAEPVIAEDGSRVACALTPDRGDGVLEVRAVDDPRTVTRIERGRRPVFSPDGAWLAAAVEPRQLERDKPAKERPKDGVVLLRTGSETPVVQRADVAQFAFSKDSAWFAYRLAADDAKKKDDQQDGAAAEPGKKKDDGKRRQGTALIVRELRTGDETTIADVVAFAFDPTSHWLAYVVAEKTGANNGLFCRALPSLAERRLDAAAGAHCTQPTWQKEAAVLAWLRADEAEDGTVGAAALLTWDGSTPDAPPVVRSDSEGAPEGMVIPAKNELDWSDDGARLFFGLQPRAFADLDRQRAAEKKAKEARDKDTERDPLDLAALLDQRGVDVWHWNDPEIVSQQKKGWSKRKEQTFLAVHHLDDGTTVQLGSEDVPRVATSDGARWAIGYRTAGYRQRTTWDGSYADLLAIDLRDGSRRPITRALSGSASLSPGGGFVAFFADGEWHLHDCARGSTRVLTAGVGVPFADEDHDYPRDVPGYGEAGWVEGDAAVLVYDKYDVWSFPTAGGAATCVTGGQGRREQRQFRIVRLDPEQKAFAPGETLLLTGDHDRLKKQGFWRATIGGAQVRALSDDDERLRFVAKAKGAERLLFTRERYDRFPDLWTADLDLRAPQRLTDANPQTAQFAWGSAELVDWKSLDGQPLQGVLIKPGNYEPGRRYPVIVYFYRFFSQRLHEWNQPVVNHRPCFPLYASNGYAIFLPDIRFEIGRPGLSASKCLIPGVQKLIDLGIADPERIGLHGHSWSGYQTAFVITQTDLFATAVAGAPVANMTSAYGGIRWESGMARQFQYEKTQSRIGQSLWQRRDLYIDNSPVFFADRIRTPLLIEFGDEDGAVPWYQGIELYLAMRRLRKECVFLSYRGEGHHLAQYPNKLDYAMKMKAWFDHYLQGAPAADWMTEGVPYLGK